MKTRVRSLLWLDDAKRDVGYALRMLHRRPMSALAAILSMCLGIGLNAAVFSVVDWVLLRPLPYPHPEQLVRVFTAGTSPVTGPAALTSTEFERVAAARSFASSASFSTTTRVLRAPDIEPAHVVVARVDGDLFATLGIGASVGRSFTRDEISAGAPVVVLGHELWRRQFRGEEAVVGGAVTIDGDTYTVVGVTAPQLHYPKEAELWRPLTARERQDDDRERSMIARLRSDASIERANVELGTIIAAAGTRRTAWADHVQHAEVRNVRVALNAVLASALLVLLIVCANVGALVGARASDRSAEMTVRGALGATRGRLVTQITTETLVVAAIGGSLGLLLGQWLLRVVVAIAPANLPRLAEITLDGRLLTAGAAMTLVVGIVAGILPAFDLARTADWRSGHGQSASPARSRARHGLVFVQVTTAVMLTIGAGLLARSLRHLVAIDNGFAADRLVAVDLYLRGDQSDTRRLFHDLIENAESLPGVEAAAVSLLLPTRLAGIRAPIQIASRSAASPPATLRPVSSRYFATIGVAVTAGRVLTEADTQTAPAVAVVNTAFVRDVLEGGAAVGIQVSTPLVRRPLSIVGVVADVTPGGEADRPAVYVSVDQVSIGGGFLLVRARDDPRSILPALIGRIRTVAPQLALDRVRRVADTLEESRGMTRFEVQLSATFAGLALLLSAVGVYGLAAGEVAARWRELAIRLALGASPQGALWTAIRPCAILVAAGAAAGVLGATAFAPHLASLLHGVDATDPFSLVAGPAVLIAAGLVAALLASWRVLRAAPAETLRGS